MTYRQGVVAAVMQDGLLLVGERLDTPGAWQLPQGGAEPGETVLQTLERELAEEVGCGQVDCLRQSTPLTYTLPAELQADFSGQTMTWCLCNWRPGAKADLNLATSNEFKTLDWWPAERIYSQVIFWKRDFYKHGLSELGVLDA